MADLPELKDTKEPEIKQQTVRRITNRNVNLLVKAPLAKRDDIIRHLQAEYGKFIKISRAHREKGHTEICSKEIKIADFEQGDPALCALSVTIAITHRTSVTYGHNMLKNQLCALLNVPKGMISITELKAPADKDKKPAPAPGAAAEPAPAPAKPEVPQIPQIDPVMQHIIQQPQLEMKPCEPPVLPPPKPLSYVRSEVQRIEAAAPAPATEPVKPVPAPAPVPAPEPAKPAPAPAPAKPEVLPDLKPLPLRREPTRLYGAKPVPAPAPAKVATKRNYSARI